MNFSELPVLNEQANWQDILPHLARVCRYILLVGPKSTTKSTTLANITGAPYRLTMHSGMRKDDFLWSRTLENGSVKVVPGPALRALQEGKELIIEEIDQSNGEIVGTLYGLLDNRPHICLPDGTVVNGVPGYKVFATTNENPSVLPGPVVDRLDCILYAKEPPTYAYVDCDPAEVEYSLRWYRKLQRKPIMIDPTPRKLNLMHQLIRAGIPNHIAAKSVFADSYEEHASGIASVAASLRNQ